MESTNENMVPVFDIEDQAQEALIRSALENSGLHYVIIDKDNHFDWSQSEPFHHYAQVRVLEHEKDQAQQIIARTLGSND